MDLTDLPNDLFLCILSYLSPEDAILCRRVSQAWSATFTSQAISFHLLKWHFPRSREMRLAAAAAGSIRYTGLESAEVLYHDLDVELQLEVEQLRRDGKDWAAVFAAVASRYHHLRVAKPRAVEKIPVLPDTNDVGSERGTPRALWRFHGVATWNRFLRLNDRTAAFHYPDPVWSYGQGEGLVVYPGATSRPPCEMASAGRGVNGVDEPGRYTYQARDLATGHEVAVPFDTTGKVVRRVRLAAGVLIFEWAEALPYHRLNEREMVHRHFVTAFDVVRRKPSSSVTPLRGNEQAAAPAPPPPPPPPPPPWIWEVTFRSEWKMHFLGLPLNRADRFFSAHTATHYAVYLWRPNRSPWGEDDPLETLLVWNISEPSEYRPSLDPSVTVDGQKPSYSPAVTELSTQLASQSLVGGDRSSPATWAPSTPAQEASSSPHSSSRDACDQNRRGPRVARRMSWGDLDFYGVRQRDTPRLRSLALDERNLYVVEEEHRWADGQHSSLSPPRVHTVKCTAIPIAPGSEPSGNGGHDGRELDSRNPELLLPVQGPRWVDECGANGDVKMSFCWRASGAAYRDRAALPSASIPGLDDARGIVPFLSRGQPPPPPSNARGDPGHFIWGSGLGQGGLAAMPRSPPRWLGLAPCWRHEDFPYLTVSEMVDSAAGVRVTARHCFMLETLSVHVRPSLYVKGPFGGASAAGGGGSGGARGDKPTSPLSNAGSVTKGDESGGRYGSKGGDGGAAASEGPRSEEVEFDDELWGELMARGQIYGDERWIVGEDQRSNITVVRF